VADTERQAILDALEATGGQKSAAALRLGVSRSQFYEKLKRHNISA
jgi:transcriptional regulator of acetoin/glycerol metabolism